MSNVIGILNGLTITSKGSIAFVQIQPVAMGIQLAAPSRIYDWTSFAKAEEALFQVVDALSIYYHVPQALGVDRKWFPVAVEAERMVTSEPVELAIVQQAFDELNNSPHSRVIRSILRVVQRADQCEDWNDRMLLLWMAFHTLYSFSKQRVERMKIAGFLTEQHFLDEELKPWVDSWSAVNGFEALYGSGLVLAKWNKMTIPVAEDLRAASEALAHQKGSYLDFTAKLLLTIFALRNQYVQRSNPALDSETERAVEMAARTLDFLVRATVQKQLNLSPVGALNRVVLANHHNGRPIDFKAL